MKTVTKALKWVIILFFCSSILYTVALRFLPVYLTPLMLIRCWEQVENGDEIKLRHQWVPLREMSPSLPVAVIASEDQRFMQHHGFDGEAIRQAAINNRQGGRVLGGSTISQQTAKNVFLWPQRSWVRKGLEAYFTFLIEMLWGKERIMEVYLNSIEMGEGIYGAEAVARDHFGVTASELTRSDCALVAATLPNPRRYSSKTPGPYMQKRQRQIEKQMRHVPKF